MLEKYTCTHHEACRRIAKWLRISKRCNVVATERRVCAVSEEPDAIGWYGTGGSILVECKVSRADFSADKTKYFRKMEDWGVGDHRYFAAPAGILTAADMPGGWGLLEITKHQVREICPAQHKQANKKFEVAMLVAAMNRLQLSATVFIRSEPEEPNA